MQSPMLMIKSTDQTQLIGNATGVLPQSIQSIDQRMHQAFQNPGRSLFERKDTPNMPRINDDEKFDEINRNRPPPLLTSSSKPIFRTIEGNFIKHDNSVHE